MYDAWSPDEGAWSDWVKPVLFGFMDPEMAPEPRESRDWELNRELLAPLGDLGKVAAIVDLPGESGVELGLQLGAFGFRPVPLYNAIPAAGAFVALEGVVLALVDGAEAVRTLPLLASPAFLLDALRMTRRQLDGVHRPYDNRSVVRETDFPSPGALLTAGIERVLLIQSTFGPPQPDLEPILLKWQHAGLSLWQIAEVRSSPAQRCLLSRRPWYQRLSMWLNSAEPYPRGDGSYGRFAPQGG